MEEREAIGGNDKLKQQTGQKDNYKEGKKNKDKRIIISVENNMFFVLKKKKIATGTCRTCIQLFLVFIVCFFIIFI